MFKGDFPDVVKGFAIFTGLLMIATGCVGVWLGVQFYDSSYANALDYNWLSLVCIVISSSVILFGVIGIVSTCFSKNAKAAVGVVTFIQFSIVGFLVGVFLIIIGSVTLYYYANSVEWLDD